MAAGQRRCGLLLAAHRDSPRNSVDTSIASLAMFVGHLSTDLLVATRTTLHSAAITTCNKWSGDHDTAVAVLDCAFGCDRVLCSPGSTEADAKLCGQFVGNKCWIDTSADNDRVRDHIWKVCQKLNGDSNSMH